MRHPSYSALLFVLPIAWYTTASMADQLDLDRVRALRANGRVLPLVEILERLPISEGGRIIEVELEEKHGRYIYEVERLEAGGIVHEYNFDATSGELLKSRIED